VNIIAVAGQIGIGRYDEGRRGGYNGVVLLEMINAMDHASRVMM
jgi:hypothetical protein